MPALLISNSKNICIRYLPILLIAISTASILDPETIIDTTVFFETLIFICLILIGCQVSTSDLSRVLNKPNGLASGLILHIVIIPIFIWIWIIFGYNDQYGEEPLTRSAVFTNSLMTVAPFAIILALFAKADIALVIMLSIFTSLWTVILGVGTTSFFIDQTIILQAPYVLLDLLQVTLLPLAIGLLMHRYLPEFARYGQQFTETSVSITLGCGVALSVANIAITWNDIPADIEMFWLIAGPAVILLTGAMICRLNQQTAASTMSVVIATGQKYTGILALVILVENTDDQAFMVDAVTYIQSQPLWLGSINTMFVSTLSLLTVVLTVIYRMRVEQKILELSTKSEF